jgi:hypothetical protein
MRSVKEIGFVLCLMAMAAFSAWPIWKWLSVKAVSAPLQERTEALVKKYPQLEPAWDIAMQDDVLTMPEAKVIIEAAGETVSPDEYK